MLDPRNIPARARTFRVFRPSPRRTAAQRAARFILHVGARFIDVQVREYGVAVNYYVR